VRRKLNSEREASLTPLPFLGVTSPINWPRPHRRGHFFLPRRRPRSGRSGHAATWSNRRLTAHRAPPV